jgi:Site-specific recombinases, DNA invertase Pin homologs
MCNEKSMTDKRFAIYIRKASKTDSSELRALSEKLEQYVCEHGGTVADKYIDNGYSGCKFRRPELKRLFKDCKLGKVNEVLILTQSHLARKLKIYRKVCDKLEKYGVSLTATDRQNIDEPIENMLLYLATKTKGFA